MSIKVWTKDNFNLKDFCNSEADFNVCWNLEATVYPTLQLLDERMRKKLSDTNKVTAHPYKLYYIPTKLFSAGLSYSKKDNNLYTIEQYYPDEAEPDMKNTEWLTVDLLETLEKMGMFPNKLTSPIAIYEQCMMSRLSLPTVWDMPKEAGYYAWMCADKLWNETYKGDYSNKTWNYDLESAFPMIARELIDIRQCHWVKRDAYWFDDAYGYAKCEVTIYPTVKVSPIIKVSEKGELTTPTGTWETYLTLEEINFIEKWQIGIVRIIDCWYATKPVKESHPLKWAIDQLLEFKQSNGGLIKRLAKAMSVGIYGKFGEEHNTEFGKYFNPCWYSEISSRARLRVAELIYSKGLQENVVSVAVDGVRLDREIEVSSEWRLKGDK